MKTNRVDIRLPSRKTAVHSDMIMWQEQEDAENAARQIINCIFADLQLSVRLAKQDNRKRKMIRFWAGFIREKKEILQEGELIAREPQNLYPSVTAIKGEQSITAVYSADRIVTLTDKCSMHTVLNGTKQRRFLVKSPRKGSCHVCLRNCLGELLEEKEMEWKEELAEFSTVPSGLIEINWKE